MPVSHLRSPTHPLSVYLSLFFFGVPGVKLSEGLLVACIGFVGVAVGAVISGSAAREVADAQIEAQRQITRSEVALKLLEYRAQPMTEIFIAYGKFKAADSQLLNAAALDLALAAASCTARLDGKARQLCSRIQALATSISFMPVNDSNARMEHAQLISVNIGKLKKIFADIQAATLKSANGEIYIEPNSNSPTPSSL
jgi:hypothetical protein